MPRLLQPHPRTWIAAATVAASGDAVGKVVAPVKAVVASEAVAVVVAAAAKEVAAAAAAAVVARAAVVG